MGDATDRPHRRRFGFSSSSSSNTNSSSRHRGLPSAAAGWLWARAGDALAAAILFLVLEPLGSQGQVDQALCLVALPLLTAAFVVVTALQGPRHASWVKRWVLASRWAGILGALSYAIYLTHEVIGDIYLQMAVKGLYTKWRGLLPPPNTPWYPTKYELYVTPWMSTQPAVLKLAALALAIVVGWLLQTYVVDMGVLALLDAGGRAWRWASTKVTSRPPSRQRSRSGGSGKQQPSTGSGAADGGRGFGWARLRVPRPGKKKEKEGGSVALPLPQQLGGEAMTVC